MTSNYSGNRPFRFAISGIHGSGKTTLCHAVVARLRESGLNAVVAPESARQSLLLAGRHLSIEMEIEVLGLQIAEEMRAGLSAQIVVGDRSVIDTYAYSLARFSELDARGCSFMDAIFDFGRSYVKTYDLIFYLPVRAFPKTMNDALRDTDPVVDLEVLSGFEKAFSGWNVDAIQLEPNRAVEAIIQNIENTYKKNSIVSEVNS
ncbi:MAG TPA: AAA family ATPase [Rhodopseudomonas sp.]|uniref:AAA family ATPase n=1 Tax=Rhodopseudomonas sp. TaxID=1078 RepID=UPI002ED8A301